MIQWSQVKKKHAQKMYLFIYVFFHLSFYLYIFFHGLIFHTETQFTDNSEYSEAISVWNLLS